VRNSAAGAASFEFFGLLAASAAAPECRRFLAARHFLPRLLAQLCAAADDAAADAAQNGAAPGAALAADEPLRALSALTVSFLELRDVRARFLRAGLAPALLRAALACARAAGAAAGGAAAAAAPALQRLLSRTAADGAPAAAAIVSACVASLRADADATAADAAAASPSAALVLSQLVALLCPVQPAPVYALQLLKSPTQEEYIRGSCGRAPIQRHACDALCFALVWFVAALLMRSALAARRWVGR
jgi:hypothetical protein